MPEILDLDRRFQALDSTYRAKLETWSDLLAERYVVVLGEGGMGKTTEFRAQAEKRRQAGDFSFFCELIRLASRSFEQALDPCDQYLIAQWRTSAREAFFFIDSLDEAKLRGNSLLDALDSLRGGLGGDWPRARLIISSRDSDWLLSDCHHLERAIGPDGSVRVVQLAPLDRGQFEKLALRVGVTDFPALWQAIQDQAAQDFTARPVDASWLAEYWAEKGQIVDLTDLIESNLEKRSRERPDRAPFSTLPPMTALRGARALAGLALLEQRWSFLVPGSELDLERRSESIDPVQVMDDWEQKDVQALLRLPLFDEGSYGRVRLHHRIVHEYLVARWIDELLDHGWPYHELERLMFRGSALGTVVPAHLQAVAAWLAASRSELADRLSKEAPEVLLFHGDPSRLSETTRRAALHALIQGYANRGYLRLWFRDAALRRFACPSLAPLVSEHLSNRAHPQELRTTLLQLVEHGLTSCVEQALKIACAGDEPKELRASAIEAVASAGSPSHHQELLAALPADSAPKLVAAAMKALYPKHLGISELVDLALRASSPGDLSSNEVTWTWKRFLGVASRKEHYDLLAALNAKLAELLLPEKSRPDLWGFELLAETIVHILSAHVAPEADVFAPELEQALELLRRASSEPWYFRADAQVDSALKKLPLLRRRLFWLAVTVRSHGSIHLETWRNLPYRRELWESSSSDIEWLRDDALGERPLPERLLAFDTLCRGLMELHSLDGLATEEPAFSAHLRTLHEESIRRQDDPELGKQKALRQKREQERKDIQSAKRQIFEDKLETIRDGNNISLLLDLLDASDTSHGSYGDVSTVSLRNAYGGDVAEAAEAGWRAFWRRHTPELRHERSKANEVKNLDVLGLVGVRLELASDADLHEWPHDDAALAARYACVEINGLPKWLEAIAAAHPRALRDGIGAAIRSEYDAPPDSSGYSALLESLAHSGPAVQAALGPIVSDCLRHSLPGSAAVAVSCLKLVAHAPEACPPPPIDVVEERCRASIDSPEHFAAWMQHWLELAPEAAVAALVELTMEMPASPVERSVRSGDLVIALLAKIDDRHSAFRSKASGSLQSSRPALFQLLPLIYRYVPESAERESARLKMDLVTPLIAAQSSRARLLSLALDIKQGLGTEQLLQLAEDPDMQAARDHILVAAKNRATQEAAGESTTVERDLTALYRKHGTGALEHLQSLQKSDEITPANLLRDVVAVGQSVIDRIAVLPKGEDEISDWLLTLLRHRLHSRGVEVGDQARGGLSASKRGAGERDAVLRHQGRIVGIFEALRMNTRNKKVLTSHLDKLPGYDVVGAPGLYVVVYFQGTKFAAWVAKYMTMVEQHTLPGWKLHVPRTDYPLDNLGVAQRVLRFAYDTPRGEQVVFHVLLDLGPARAERATPSKAASPRKKRG